LGGEPEGHEQDLIALSVLPLALPQAHCRRRTLRHHNARLHRHQSRRHPNRHLNHE
jgi:hypothetical protein